MNLVRISAEDERLIARATTLAELNGIKSLMMDRIEQAKVLKSFGKVAKLKDETFSWRDVARIFDEVMGKARVTRPPFPEYTWYQRMGSAIKKFQMDEESTKLLAEYCRDHLRDTNNLEFMVMQQRRIMAGEFDAEQLGKVTKAALPELPEE